MSAEAEPLEELATPATQAVTPGVASGPAGPAPSTAFAAFSRARSVSPAQVMALQRSAGNQAVARLIDARRAEDSLAAPLPPDQLVDLATGPATTDIAAAEPTTDGHSPSEPGATRAGPGGRTDTEASDPSVRDGAKVGVQEEATPEGAPREAATEIGGPAATPEGAPQEATEIAGPAATPPGAAASEAKSVGQPVTAAGAAPDGDGRAATAASGSAPETEPADAGTDATADSLQAGPATALGLAEGAGPPTSPPTAGLAVARAPEGEEEEGGGLLDGIRRRISGVVGGLRSGWDQLSSGASEAFAAVQQRVGSAVEGLTSLGGSLVSGLQTAWSAARGVAAGLTDWLKRQIGSAAGGIAEAFGRLRDAVMSLDADTIEAAWAAVTGAVGGVWNRVQGAGRALTERLSGLFSGLSSRFTAGLTSLQERGGALMDGVRTLAGGLKDRLSSAWGALTSRADQLSGIGGAAYRVVQSIVNRLVSAGHAVWGGIQNQWAGLRERAGGLAASAGERLSGVWTAVKDRASEAWGGIREGWDTVSSGVRTAAGGLVDGVRGIAGRFSGLSITGFVGKLRQVVPGIRAIESAARDPEGTMAPWAEGIASKMQSEVPGHSQSILAEKAAEAGGGGPAGGASGNGPVAAPGAPGLPPAAGGAAATDSGPPAAGPTAAPAQAVARSPRKVAREARTGRGTARAAGGAAGFRIARGGSGLKVARLVERSTTGLDDIVSGVWEAIQHKWAEMKVLELVKHVLWSIVWPWPGVWGELKGIWADWKTAVGTLFMPRNLFSDPLGFLHDLWSDVLKLLDFPLILWRRLNNIGMLLMGWVTIALVILGAIGGSVAGGVVGGIVSALATVGIAAPAGLAGGAAAGGVAGAGAGFGAAMLIGEALVYSTAIAEGATIVKALLDLGTARQTAVEKIRDYNQVADSTLVLAILGALALLGWIGGRIASAAAPMFRRFVPARLAAAAEEFAAGMKGKAPAEEADGCFAAGTLVLTPTGRCPIEALRRGDEVLAVDERGGEPEAHRVKDLWVIQAPRTLVVHAGGARTRCSPGHPFRVLGRGWLTARELRPGAALVDAAGTRVTVDAVVAAEGSQVFNLHVEGPETFFVSERDLLVHNKPQRARVEPPELVEARAMAEPRLNQLEARAQRAIERAQAEPADTPGRAEMIEQGTQLKERVAQIHDDVALAESEAQVRAQEAPERAASEQLDALENRLRLGRFNRSRAAARKSLGELRERMKGEDFRKLDGETRSELEGEMRSHDAEARRIEADTEAVEGDPSLADLAADEWDALNRRVQDLTKEVGDAINPPSGTTIPRPHLNYPKNMLPTEGVRYTSPGPGEVVQAPEGGGYLDNQGRVWQVDRTKARVGKFFEWDVQTPDGGHINVGSDGNITH